MKTIILIIVSLMLASMVYADGQINISYVPYTISTPGSYIVVKDLHAASNQTAIIILTSNVNIDLNGHTLYGTNGAFQADGISSVGNSNILVMNGTVRDFRGIGIRLISGDYIQVTKIKCLQNYYGGIDIGTAYCKAWDNECFNNLLGPGLIRVGDASEVSGNIVNSSVADGISAGNNCRIGNNIASNNGGYGIRGGSGCIVTNNCCRGNTWDGIYADVGSSICNNDVNSNTLSGIETGDKCIITNNCCNGNNSYGINAGDGSVITNNTFSYNTMSGIHASDGSSVIGNTVNKNGFRGIDVTIGCNVKDNIVQGNTSIGIFTGDGCTIKDNTVRANYSGIYVSNRSQVIGNTVSNNTTGIVVDSAGDANVVAYNHITGNNTGIICDPATHNYFHSNTLRFNITPTDIVGGNTLGAGDLANVSY